MLHNNSVWYDQTPKLIDPVIWIASLHIRDCLQGYARVFECTYIYLLKFLALSFTSFVIMANILFGPKIENVSSLSNTSFFLFEFVILSYIISYVVSGSFKNLH